ncbi:plasmid pRiA4b ORF-3 family protein [Sporosarcina sp. FSL K6-3457]|uniref:plasmid pRiA4b ORF-3 family protein n=1 Tax=Sporosarcina sp. FSL K6-3457 TaxID=2978204 RepID=UPI0030F6EABE
MRIHSTKKLLDELAFTPTTDAIEEENSLFSWHANMLMINRRKTVVLMNDQNRYVIVLHGLKAKDFKQFDVIVEQAIRQVFRAERISEEVIEQYMKAAGAVSFSKTKNRSMVARLNQACDSVWLYAAELDLADVVNKDVSKNASRLLVGGGKVPSIYPYEELFKDLAAFTGGNIFDTDVAVMRVSMELMEHSIWRKLIIPLDMPVREFHEVLQIVFDWQDYHLHEFYLYDETNTDKPRKPKLNIVMDEEAFEYGNDVEMVLEEGLLLSDFIPPHTFIKYIYDFGDYWRHDIVVEEILTKQNIQSPACLEGEGTAPPEDCGGESGFSEFLTVMSDPSDLEHESMKEWAKMQWYREFERNFVNRRLKKL